MPHDHPDRPGDDSPPPRPPSPPPPTPHTPHITPNLGFPGATFSATPTAPPRFRNNTIGRRAHVNNSRSSLDISHNPSATPTSATITANGFSSRPFRRRNSATTSARRASHTR